MPGAGDDRERVGREGFGARVELAWRPPHHGQIHLVAVQTVDQILAVALGEADIDARMVLEESGQQAGQEILGRSEHADRQAPDLDLAQSRDQVFGVLERGEDAPGMHQQIFPRDGQRNGAAAALEQRKPDQRLELADLHRDRRRGQVQLFGGAHEAQVPCDRGKYLELACGGPEHQ